MDFFFWRIMTYDSDIQNHVGCGIYSVAQAARLLRIDASVLRRWIGEGPGCESVISRTFEEEQILTFAELMELHFIKMFREENVSLQAIRKAAQMAAQKFRSNYPFTVKRFDTDGKTIFATLKSKETDKELIQDLRQGQLVFATVIRPFFKRLDYLPTQEVGLFWPLRKSSRQNGRVVLDPKRRYGQPIDSETGVPTSAITQALAAGDGQDVNTVAKWFDIPVEAVKAAIRFEKSLSL
jgi:uncharacterized protein (DUF433 family)/DNA-binding transcriptional MerR regulator